MSDISTATDLVLDVKGLKGGYGQIQVLHGLDFHVAVITAFMTLRSLLI